MARRDETTTTVDYSPSEINWLLEAIREHTLPPLLACCFGCMEEGGITILASASLELNGIALKLRESRWAELSFRIISIVLDLPVFTYNNNNIIEGKWIE